MSILLLTQTTITFLHLTCSESAIPSRVILKQMHKVKLHKFSNYFILEMLTSCARRIGGWYLDETFI